MSGHRDRIRAVIVDDEPLARQNLRLLLAADPEVELVAECGDGRRAVDVIREESPDLLLLDIQMPEVDGFQVLERIDMARPPVVVFVTAFDQHAIRAFEVHAFDYLLKPFDDGRFVRALERAKEEIRKRQLFTFGERLLTLLEERDREGGRQYLARVLVKTPHRVFFIPVEEIDWVEAAGSYVEIHARGGAHLLREAMNALVEKLDPRQFVRIHRSTTVNIARVAELRPDAYGDYVVVLQDGTRLKMSRNRREQVEARLMFGQR